MMRGQAAIFRTARFFVVIGVGAYGSVINGGSGAPMAVFRAHFAHH